MPQPLDTHENRIVNIERRLSTLERSVTLHCPAASVVDSALTWRAAQLIRRLEWSGTDSLVYGDQQVILEVCPACRGFRPGATPAEIAHGHEGHTKDCELDVVLGSLGSLCARV